LTSKIVVCSVIVIVSFSASLTGGVHGIEVGAINARRQAFPKSLVSQLFHLLSVTQVVLIAAAKPWKVPLKGLSEGRLERHGTIDTFTSLSTGGIR